MPIRDLDGGLVWAGYNPSIFSQKTPATQQQPFYFAGSQVPLSVGTMAGKGKDNSCWKNQNLTGLGLGFEKCKVVKKLPGLRK